MAGWIGALDALHLLCLYFWLDGDLVPSPVSPPPSAFPTKNTIFLLLGQYNHQRATQIKNIYIPFLFPAKILYFNAVFFKPSFYVFFSFWEIMCPCRQENKSVKHPMGKHETTEQGIENSSSKRIKTKKRTKSRLCRRYFFSPPASPSRCYCCWYAATCITLC